MKSISIVLNCLLLSIILFHACKNRTNTAAITQPSHSYCSDTGCVAVNRSDLNGMISYELAVKMSADYRADAGKDHIYDGTKETDSLDTKSIWFSLAKLKNYIAYIEYQACRSGCNTDKILGIRVNFAKYPSEKFMATNDFLRDVPKRFQNHHTVFFSATYYDPQSQKHIDFDPEDVAGGCALFPIQPEKGHVWLGFTGASEGGGNQKNHGDVAPPPDGAGNFPVIPDPM